MRIDLRLEQTDLCLALIFLLLFDLCDHVFHDLYDIVV